MERTAKQQSCFQKTFNNISTQGIQKIEDAKNTVQTLAECVYLAGYIVITEVRYKITDTLGITP